MKINRGRRMGLGVLQGHEPSQPCGQAGVAVPRGHPSPTGTHGMKPAILTKKAIFHRLCLQSLLPMVQTRKLRLKESMSWPSSLRKVREGLGIRTHGQDT